MASKAQYVRAFRKLDAEGLARSWKGLLRAHWASPGHTSSMALLAGAAGYKNHSAANLNYGRLAARLGRLVGMPPRPSAGEPVCRGYLGAIRSQARLGTSPSRCGRRWRGLSRRWGGRRGPARLPTTWTLAAFSRASGACGSRSTSSGSAGCVLGSWRRHSVARRTVTSAARCPAAASTSGPSTVRPGRGYAEVHHLKPLGSRRRSARTPLEDLAWSAPTATR